MTKEIIPLKNKIIIFVILAFIYIGKIVYELQYCYTREVAEEVAYEQFIQECNERCDKWGVKTEDFKRTKIEKTGKFTRFINYETETDPKFSISISYGPFSFFGVEVSIGEGTYEYNNNEEQEIWMKYRENNFTPDFVIGIHYYYRDGKFYYREKAFDYGNYASGVELKTNIDLNTRKYINWGYSKDKNHVYYGIDIIEGADPNTIQLYEKNRVIDKNHVYYLGKIIEGADPETFVTISRTYGKDKNHVYFLPCDEFVLGQYECDDYITDIKEIKVIEGADLETFSEFGKNKENGNETFLFQYAIDKNHVYYLGKIIEGADPETFIYTGKLGQPSGEDNNNKYIRDKKTK